MSRLSALLYTSLATMVLSANNTANADILYDNLPPTSSFGGTAPIVAVGAAFNSFSTGTADTALTDVKMILSGDPTNTAQFTVTLLSDSSGQPGSLLTTLGTFDDSTLSGTDSVYDIPVPSYGLVANTRYWIELSGSASSVAWDYAANGSGVGIIGEYWAYSPSGTIIVSANSTDNWPFQMQVTTTSASVVPEPGTMSLTLSALGLSIVVLARRRSTLSRFQLI
ncbi:MAG: choice-of-anchor R domain-containing protein [Schlesneria sp.]